jgi:hypothetical protein
MVSSPSTTFTQGKLVTSAFLNSEVDRRSQNPSTYVVWYDGTNYHADSMTGLTDSTPATDPTPVIQGALTNA